MIGDEFLLSGDSLVGVVGTHGEPARIFSPLGELRAERTSPPAGRPGPLNHGTIDWWESFRSAPGPREPGSHGRLRPMERWFALGGKCLRLILGTGNPALLEVHAASPPGGSGAWPPFASRGDQIVIGDGYSYRLWKFDDLDRKFLRTTPKSHFQYGGLSFDGSGILWVIGVANDSMFLDVFADTTYLGRRMIDCRRSGYAATVRGHWLAMACRDDDAVIPVKIRLYRIVG